MDGWMRSAAYRKKLLFAAALAALFLTSLAGFLPAPRARALPEDFQPLRQEKRVLVWVYGELRVLPAGEETVGQLLRRSGLAPAEEDRLSCPADTAVRDGMELRIDRILSRQELCSVTLPHETVVCRDPTLPAGTQQIIVAGSDGELLRRDRVRYINGGEAERTTLAETMLRAPVTEILAVGTGAALPEKEEGLRIADGYIYLPTGEVLRYRDTAQVRATAYTHTDEGCDMTYMQYKD